MIEAVRDDTIDGTGPLGCDLGCTGCGYNLRGLERTGRCPECDAAVAWSLRGQGFVHEDPRVVRRIVRGLRWCAATWLVWPILVVSENIDHAIIWLTNAVPGVIGYWLLTTPTRKTLRDLSFDNARMISRGGMAIGRAGFVVWVLAQYAWPFGAMQVGTYFLELLILSAMAVGSVAVLIYEQKLAAYIPDARLARQFKYLLYLYVAAAGLSWVISAMDVSLSRLVSALPGSSSYIDLWYTWGHALPLGGGPGMGIRAGHPAKPCIGYGDSGNPAGQDQIG